VIKHSFHSSIGAKDGVSVARSIELKDKVKNIGASLEKHVVSATSDLAGVLREDFTLIFMLD